MKLYPLKFIPILKDKIWGGKRLQSLYAKEPTSEMLGESWEISGVEGDVSVVSNGFLEGNDLEELIEIYMGELVGDKVYDQFGLSFPLLFKLIDANDDLSIQVHPNDEVAAERHQSFGKTEMWYVLESAPDGALVIGFKDDCDKESYLKTVEAGRVEELLQRIPVKKGDVFYIPAGTVHAIGRGVVLAEIQQSSDITYRIYDYKRVDEHGRERDLHTAEAVDVIHFEAAKHPRTDYLVQPNALTTLAKCEYFNTSLISFDSQLTRNYGQLDSFVVYMCVGGSLLIECDGTKTEMKQGETVLIPASIDELHLIPMGKAELLEVYVP